MHTQPSLDGPTSKDIYPNLGKLIDRYPVRSHKLKRWLRLLLGVSSILASLLLSVALLYRTWERMTIHGRAVILTIFPLPVVLYGSLLVVGLVLVTLALFHWRDRFEVYEMGIVQYKAKRVKKWLFAETERFDSHISQIMFGGSLVTTQVKIHFENKAGKHWVIQTPYASILDLIQNLRECLLPHLIQRAHQRLQDGEILSFHKDLQATEQGLSIKDHCVPFSEIQATIKNQHLKLCRNENPPEIVFKTRLTKVKNLEVLLAFLEYPPAQP
jgi:hypothetical protein